MGQIQMIVSLVMIALFSIAIVNFAINFASNNDSAVSLADDTSFSDVNTNIQSNLSQFKEDSGQSFNTLITTTQESGDQSASTGGQFKVGIWSSITNVYEIMNNGYKKIFGEDKGFGIFLTALSSVLIYIAGLYVWKSWRGNPD
jgi:hypothetical protein